MGSKLRFFFYSFYLFFLFVAHHMASGQSKGKTNWKGFAEHLERKTRSAKPILLPLRVQN